MGGSVDVRIHPDADARLPARFMGDARDFSQFGFGFDAEHVNAGGQSLIDLDRRLADPREYDALRWNTRHNRAIEFAATDDIRADSGRVHQAQQREIRIGFHGVADEMFSRADTGPKFGEPGLDEIGGVYEERRTVLAGQFFDGNAVKFQPALSAVCERPILAGQDGRCGFLVHVISRRVLG